MPDLWPYVPLPDIREEIAWNTDIRQTYGGEMRDSYSDGRQVLTLRHGRSTGFQAIAARFRGAPYGDWLVPFWHQGSRVASIGSVDTTLAVDTDADYADQAVIWENCDSYLVVDIDSIATDELTLTGAVGQDFTNARVMPVRLCHCAGGTQIGRSTRRHSSMEISFEAYDGFAPSGVSYPTLDGYPFFACASAVVRPLVGRIVKEAERVESGFGAIELVAQRSVIETLLGVSVAQTDAAEKHEFRRFLGDMRGQDGVFWVQDWEGKLELAAALSSGGVTATITAILDDVADYVGRAVKIGDELRTITGASDLGGGQHQITFAALTANASTAQLLRQVRLNTDRIEFRHVRDFVAETDFTVIDA